MYIGYYENPKLSYHLMGSDEKLTPTKNLHTGWDEISWKHIYNSALDIRVELSRECFVGAVTLPFGEMTKVYKIEVLSEGKTVGLFTAETGRYATGTITVAVGTTLSKFTVRIYNAISDISFEEVRISVAYEDGTPLVWPTPKSFSCGEGSVRIGNIIAGDGEDAAFAKQMLEEELALKFGRDITCPTGVALTVKLDASYERERITVSVSESGITLKAGGRLALCRGTFILISMITPAGTLSVCELDDTPATEMRGFHIGIPARKHISFVKDFYRYVLLPLGYNQIFVQFCGGMRYDSHPEITEAWLEGNRLAKEGKCPQFPHDYMGAEGSVLEKDEVRDLIAYAKSLGFEIIPEVQSLAHVQYITFAHPEIGEVDADESQVSDTRAEDLRPDKRFIHCYCPSNEESYRIIFDLIDEIIEVVRPERYVHIGHDEVYHLGLCPKCKGKSHAELFVGDVMRIYNYLKGKGLGTMMWGDMLQPVTKYNTKPAINMLPKDIVQLDFIWYFHLDKNIEDNLIAAGYTTIVGNLYSSHFPRYRSRMLNSGMKGGQISTWCAPNEYALGKKGKFWDTTYTAQLLSRPELCEDDMRWTYSYIFAKYIQPLQRDIVRGKYSPKGWQRKSIALKKGDRSGIPDGIIAERAKAQLAESARVKIGGYYERLAIEGATLNIGIREPWVPLKVCGEYIIKYCDGTEERIPLEYAGGIQYYNRRYGEPYLEPFHRHTGYSATWFSDPTVDAPDGFGGRILLSEFIVENPHPDKKIAYLEYESREGDSTKPIITALCGLNRIK